MVRRNISGSGLNPVKTALRVMFRGAGNAAAGSVATFDAQGWISYRELATLRPASNNKPGRG